MNSPSEFDLSWGICSTSTVTSSVPESSSSSVTVSFNTRFESEADSGISKIATCLSYEIVVETLQISSHSYRFLSTTVWTCWSWFSGNGNSIYVKTYSRTFKCYYLRIVSFRRYMIMEILRSKAPTRSFRVHPLIFLHLSSIYHISDCLMLPPYSQ